MPNVVYVPEHGMVPHIPADPDIMAPVLVRAPGMTARHGRLPNGLTPRADCMARLVARGVGPSDAYRAAYAIEGHPLGVSQRANKIASTARYGDAVVQYRQRLEQWRAQNSVSVRSFVLGRLTIEAQRAPEASARIKALDLLGKSEGMWTTVHRTEKAINPKDLAALKDQLAQRLKQALEQYAPRAIADQTAANTEQIDSQPIDKTGE